MKEHFHLQFKMANRTFVEIGLEPVIAYILLAGSFIGISIFIFENTVLANYIFLIIASFIISKSSEIRRNEFLKLCYGANKYRIIRITENLLLSLPFILFLSYQNEYLYALILIVIATIFSVLNFKISLNFVIPTPFSKEPFEFCIGFRKSFYFYIIAYGLAIISISVNNLNLGIFSLLLIFAIILTYYSKPEKEYFVWNFNQNPREFLINKITTGLKFSCALAFPIYIGLLVFNLHKFGIISLFLIIGMTFITYIIVAKYAYYPNEFSLIQVLFLVLSILFPPLLIILIPYFYSRAKNQLNIFLE